MLRIRTSKLQRSGASSASPIHPGIFDVKTSLNKQNNKTHRIATFWGPLLLLLLLLPSLLLLLSC